ncbi:MAG: hypothetical protein NTW07_07270 [candidate division Zixibacteria bacterium]|nr:hypothetical protein [candidate division Zixibacteria bacterium]
MDELVRLLSGTIVLLIVGYFRLGQRAFQFGFMDSPFLSIGITGSLVYLIFKRWGERSAIGTSVLLSILNAALARSGYVTVWSETFAMMLVLVLLCHCLAVWKIERPVIGRLLLLGPLFAFVGWVLTFGFRLLSYREHMLEASKNNAVHGFILGVGLAIGLELAELIVRYQHSKLPQVSRT